jgi:tetratricopeptide (TPR) repeat protein
VLVLAMRGPPAEFIDDPDLLGAETVEVSQLLMGGDRAGGSRRADEIVAEYAETGGARYAAALNLRGFAHYYNGELAQAETVLVKSVTLAEETNARRIKAIAIGQLVHTLEDLGKHEDAKRWSGMVVASARSPTETDIQLAGALDADAHRLARAGNLEVAIAKYGRAAAIWASIGNLGAWAANRGMLAKNFGNILQHDAACGLVSAALLTLDVVPHERAQIQEALIEASIANGGAICEMGRGRPEQSAAYAERALAATIRAVGDRSPQLETPLIHLGRALASTGDVKGSHAAFDRALALPGTDRERIATLGLMAVTAFETKQFETAVGYAERMVALADKALTDNHPERVGAKLMLAKLLFKANNFDRARPLAEELLVIYQTVEDPLMLADTWFLLARMVDDPKRARTLAEQARATYRAAGSVRAPHLADVDRFLATR